MRVLFTCAAGLGHVFPLVPLARAAVAAGDEVLFAVPTEGIVDGRSSSDSPQPSSPTVIPVISAGPGRSCPTADVNTYVVADIFVRVQALAALPALQAAIRDPQGRPRHHHRVRRHRGRGIVRSAERTGRHHSARPGRPGPGTGQRCRR